METELFSWNEWDGDEKCMNFYGVVLKKPIGEYPVGTKFDQVNILHKEEGGGVLQIAEYVEGVHGLGQLKLVAEYNLYYTVGDKLNS